MKTLEQFIDQMTPDEAIQAVTPIIKRLFPYISEKSRLNFLEAFTSQESHDGVAGLVHL